MKHALLLLCLITAQSHAQIIYTDVIPDQLYNTSGDTCHLDLNSDGITDFHLSYRFFNDQCGAFMTPCYDAIAHWTYIAIDPLVPNAVCDTNSLPSALRPVAVIDGTLAWSSAGSQSLADLAPHCSGPPAWVCVVDHIGQWSQGISADSSRYLGLRFDIAGTTHYGWARLNIPSYPSSFTVKDYAYNSVPDELILAGEGADISTGIADITRSSMRIFPNPTSGKFSVEGLDNSQATSLEVRDAMGQMIQRSVIPDQRPMIDISSRPSGIYLITIRTTDEMITRKLIKQ